MSWLGNKTAQEQLELKHLCIDNFPTGINKPKRLFAINEVNLLSKFDKV